MAFFRILFLRLNFFAFALSGLSLYLGLWLGKRLTRKGDRVLNILHERLEEQIKALHSEYKHKFYLVQKKIYGFINLGIDKASHPFFHRELANLKEFAESGDLAEFDALVDMLFEELDNYHTDEEVNHELKLCQKRIRIYKKSTNDAVRLFNMALSHYGTPETSFNFVSLIQ